MFIEIRTTLNTVLPAHREVLKLLHQVGALEEQEIRAHLASQEPVAPSLPTPDAQQLEIFNEPNQQNYFDAKEALVNGDEG